MLWTLKNEELGIPVNQPHMLHSLLCWKAGLALRSYIALCQHTALQNYKWFFYLGRSCHVIGYQTIHFKFVVYISIMGTLQDLLNFRVEIKKPGVSNDRKVKQLLQKNKSTYTLKSIHIIFAPKLTTHFKPLFFMWGFPKMGVPQKWWFIVENPNLKWMMTRLGVSPFQEPPK